MKSTFLKRLQDLNSSQGIQNLRGIKRGFEKECLRVDKEGLIAATPHPHALGSSLLHPMITTDYAEALLEFITPPVTELKDPLHVLEDLHQYTYHHLKEEILWAGSMPCRLPPEEEILIATYGSSNLGLLKHIYRQGLGYRYGRLMQTIAGIHYNFSLSPAFWLPYQAMLGSTMPLSYFMSEQYLGLIRNGLRFGWLLPLLFGASPAVSSAFLKEKKPELKEWGEETYIGPYATSLRLSDLGYHNRKATAVSISYNSLTEFLQTMKKAVHTPFPEYSRIGVIKKGEYRQLSDSLFQVEDEHYALIRPKRVSQPEERMLAAIERQGIEYIEIRALDINPFILTGIEIDTVYFLDIFLIVCLLMESPPLTEVEMQRIGYNQSRVARQGRQPELCLIDKEGNFRELTSLALEFLEMMQAVADLLDKSYGIAEFKRVCETASNRLVEPEGLPSSRVLQEMIARQESYFDFTWRWSLNHAKYFQNKEMSPSKWSYYTQLSNDSLVAEKALEARDKVPFAEYLQHYLAI